jgi:hypothetical protein
MKPNTITIYQSLNKNWFVRIDDNLVAGFTQKDDAIFFVEHRWPDAERVVKE